MMPMPPSPACPTPIMRSPSLSLAHRPSPLLWYTASPPDPRCLPTSCVPSQVHSRKESAEAERSPTGPSPIGSAPLGSAPHASTRRTHTPRSIDHAAHSQPSTHATTLTAQSSCTHLNAGAHSHSLTRTLTAWMTAQQTAQLVARCERARTRACARVHVHNHGAATTREHEGAGRDHLTRQGERRRPWPRRRAPQRQAPP